MVNQFPLAILLLEIKGVFAALAVFRFRCTFRFAATGLD